MYVWNHFDVSAKVEDGDTIKAKWKRCPAIQQFVNPSKKYSPNDPSTKNQRRHCDANSW